MDIIIAHNILFSNHIYYLIILNKEYFKNIIF